MPITKVTKYSDLLPISENAHFLISPKQSIALNEGVQGFLTSTNASIEIEADGAGLLAGQFQIETSDLVIETFATAAELISGCSDPDFYLKSLPSIALWLASLYKNTTLIKKKNAAFCVFKALLIADARLGGTTSISAQTAFADLSCRNGRSLQKACRFAEKAGCSITLRETRMALAALARQQLIAVAGADAWVVLKK